MSNLHFSESQQIPVMNNFNYQGVNSHQSFSQSAQYPVPNNDSPYMNGQIYQQSTQIQNNEQNQSNLNSTQFKNSQYSTDTMNNSATNKNNDLRCLNFQPQEKCYVEHLDLNTFKIEKCKNAEQHNQYRCPYYHNQFDRRRPKQILSDQCDLGERCLKENCIKSHNSVEVHYSKDQYKKKFCKSFKSQNNCEYGNFCSFAHSEQDILIELIHLLEKDEEFYLFHYKTVMCPFIEDHPRDLCEYSHNTQDYRRKPDQYSYEPETCPQWPSKDKIQNYQNGCPEGYNCTKCHGWKELDYHPRVYKTKSCTQCKKQQNCPNYHSPKEKRVVPTHVNQKIFRLVPKNPFFLAMKRDTGNNYSNSQTPNIVNNNYNTNNYMGNMNNSSPQTNNVQQFQQFNITQFQQQPTNFYINQNSSIQQQNNHFSNTNSSHINSNNNRKYSKHSYISTNKSALQNNNDQNQRSSVFQTNSQQYISQEQYQSNNSSILLQKQFQVFNPPKEYLNENQVINPFENQNHKFSESVNLQSINENQQIYYNKSNTQPQQVMLNNINWVVNENYNVESGDETISPHVQSRKKSYSEGEINLQMNQLNIDKSNQIQNTNYSQNDLQNRDSCDKLSYQKSQSSTKSIERKSLKLNSNKKNQDYKEDKDDSNSQVSSKNQLSEDQKFQSNNSYTNQSQSQNQTSTFNLYQTSEIRNKQIEDMLNGDDD